MVASKSGCDQWDSGDEDIVWYKVKSVIFQYFMIGGVIKMVAIKNVELFVANIMGMAKRLIEILGSQINLGNYIVKGCKKKGI